MDHLQAVNVKRNDKSANGAWVVLSGTITRSPCSQSPKTAPFGIFDPTPQELQLAQADLRMLRDRASTLNRLFIYRTEYI